MPGVLALVVLWISASIMFWLTPRMGDLFGRVLPRARVLIWIGGPASFAAYVTMACVYLGILLWVIAGALRWQVTDSVAQVVTWLGWLSLVLLFLQGIARPTALA